ncbi:hypothetical protein V5O48_004157 [Marasmius crinis-equi]|uniref:DUF6534 domain-containing protein n=1 Tax=Marasmius crinis-equi TaxID=585013 RepID=A0ABR3FQX1_9AGAR
MAPAPGIPADVRHVAGPLIITFMLGTILYGVQILQVYTYYMTFPKDRKIVKALVYIVFLLDTTQTAIFFRDAYTIFAAGFGDMAALRAAHLSGFSVPIITGLVSLLVQSFYSYQIQVLSRSWILTVVILSVGIQNSSGFSISEAKGILSPKIALTQFVASIIEGVFIFKINNSAILQAKTLVPCTIWLAGSALCDIIIAVAMTAYLMKASSGLKGNHIIRRLVRLVIETGSLTATVATIDVILFIGLQKYPYHMLPSRCLAKLYANTLMVILNSRMRIQGSRDDPQPNHLYSGWSQSIDIRFARSRFSRTTNLDRTGQNFESTAPVDSSRSHPPQSVVVQKVVTLDDMDGTESGSTSAGVELPKNVYRDSL